MHNAKTQDNAEESQLQILEGETDGKDSIRETRPCPSVYLYQCRHYSLIIVIGE